MEEGNSSSFLNIRRDSRLKINAIAKRQRWTLRETVDAIADEYMAAHGIEVEQPSCGTPASPSMSGRRTQQSTAATA